MSRNTDKEMQSSSCVPSAPPGLGDGRSFCQDDFAARAPPPTYEESQRPQNVALPGQVSRHVAPPVYPPVTNNQFYGMTHHQQLPTAVHMHGYNTQMQPIQQITTYSVYNQNDSNVHTVTQPNVLSVDPRAELRTTATGAVIVPPPPPGCSPTPAQLAAMQGQPVVVKQKKRTFF